MLTTPMLTIEQVAERYQVSQITITRWCNAGIFPQPIRIGRRCRRWLIQDLNAFDTAAKPQPKVDSILQINT